MLEKIKSYYEGTCRYIGAMQIAPTKKQAQICLLLLGIVILTAGVGLEAMAQGGSPLSSGIDASRITKASDKLLIAIQGPFGALIMIVAGIFAIVCAAMGNYKLALSLLVISLGAFILRSIIATFFNVGALSEGY